MPGDFLSEAQRAAYSRTLGLRRSGCSRPEDLSVHSCSIATQTPGCGDRRPMPPAISATLLNPELRLWLVLVC